jgi:hypothetical protein
MHADADRRNTRGKKELVGFQTGVREGAQSWRELLMTSKSLGSRLRRTWRSATARSASGASDTNNGSVASADQ